jgi:hypothetical protein
VKASPGCKRGQRAPAIKRMESMKKMIPLAQREILPNDKAIVFKLKEPAARNV